MIANPAIRMRGKIWSSATEPRLAGCPCPLAGCFRLRRDGERLLSAWACHRDRFSETLGREALAGGTKSFPDGADVFGGSCPISRPAFYDRVGRTARIRHVLKRPNHPKRAAAELALVKEPGNGPLHIRSVFRGQAPRFMLRMILAGRDSPCPPHHSRARYDPLIPLARRG